MAESDLEYNRKLESLQRYIPFLNNMMTELRAKGNRDPQIAKIQSLREIITNTKKKLKLETLDRCEEVITSIYEKVNPQLRLGKSSAVPECPRSTPQSPSPPRDVLLTKPVTIPTEKITTTALSHEKRASPKLARQKIDVYSNVVISSTSTAKIQLPTKLPDLSKPPISLDDLKTLEEDVHLHIIDTDYAKKTVDELQEVKKQLQLQLRVENIKSDSHSQDSSVKNSARKLSATTTSKTSLESNNSKPTIIEKKSSSPLKSKREEIKFTIKDRNKSSTNKTSSVNLLKDSDLFSNTLAVIDNKLINENKKVKKVDSKRSSISKEPDGKSKESSRKGLLVENSKSSSTSSTPSRLADKYNPKPRQKSLESPKEEVQKVVNNKVEPRKESSFTKTSSNVNVEKKLNIPSQIINPTTSVQLPEVLQKIFNTKSIVMDTSSQIGAQTNLYNNADFNSQSIMQNQQNIQYNQAANFQNNDRYDQQQYYGGTNYDYGANSNLTGRHTLLPTPTTMGNINFPNTQSNFDQSSSSLYSQFDQSNIEHSMYNNNPQSHYGSSLNNCTPVYGANSYPNAFDSSASSYYGSSQANYIPEQNNFQDCTRWNNNNDRRSSDPRNYKEYRERKERQEKELKAQQERELNARKERELKETQVKDPRLRKDSFSSTSKDSVSSKIKSDERDLRISSWGKKGKNTDSNSRPRDTNKFDQMYSNTNKSSSEGNDGWDNDFWGDTDESVNSSLNNTVEKVNADKVCEVKSFKIPKKTQKETERDQLEENKRNKSKDRGKSSKNQKNSYNTSSKNAKNRQRVLIHISSDENDSNNLKDNNSLDLVDEISDDNNDDVISTKKSSKTPHKSGIDTSRVKVVFKSPNRSLSPERDCAEFVSEYDKEFSKETPVEKETIKVNEIPSTSGLSKKSTDASKESTEKGNESESDESCEEIKLFSHYMENILKTVTKKDRSAMISVLEILQDKLGKKKDKNNEGDDSAKEETISKIKKLDEEEAPVVGSTTEEMIEQPELNIIKKSNETQVNEITKSSDLDDATDETDETFKESETEPEPVVETVSERIKNRKRLPGKKHKTELDMLHEDIQEMFIRDGVLTATGKRMCRILKDDTNPTIEEKDVTAASPEQIKNIRKKPGPKSKTTCKNSSDSLKDVRVIINKIPDEVIATTSVRQLRNRNSKVNYDDDNEINNEESIEKVNEELNNVEVESVVESDEENKTNSTVEETPKSKSKRRKTPRWAVGIIPKTKRRRLNNAGDNKSDGSAEISFSELSDLADVKRLIEPDKNYFYDFVTKQKLDCRLCNYEGHGIAIHYFKEHPESEILCSRLPPDIAIEAIKDYKENENVFEKIQLSKGNITKNRYSCRICGYDNAVSSGNFYEHVTTHTGEYRHKCALCVYSTASGRSLLQHYNTIHPGEERNTIRTSYPQAIIFGYLCGDCNFIQLEKKNVEAHVNLFHSIKHPTILKINMSSIMDPSLLKMIPMNEDESTNKINKTSGTNKPTRRRGIAKINNKSTTEDESEKEPEIKNAETPPVVRRRRGTFHLLINEDSGDDIDDIITLSSRSSRAAKDKATAKLKTMMENISSEASSPPKKKPENVEANLKVNDEIMPQREETVTSKLEEKKLATEVVEFKKKYEQKSKADLNVFTCKTDFMEQEKQIVEDRLRKMEELNKSFSARPSNMDFINKLSNKLAANNVMEVKEESKEDATADEPKNIVEKSSEKEPSVRLPLPIVDLTSPSISKKPILEDKLLTPHQPNIKFRQDRSNSLFSNMIEKLKGKVNEEASSSSAKDNSRSESESLTAAATFSMAGLIKIVKDESDITFICYADGCNFSTTDIIVFKLHCKSAHKNLELTACQCDKCGQVIETTLDTTLLENLFDHFNFAHSDFDQPVIRTRKLSGDKLSAVKQETEESLDNNKIAEKEKLPTAASESTLENNPFSFKISNVMSLAGSNLNEEQSAPPLALINMSSAILPVLKQPSFIVKEAKLTPSELLRPKKSDLSLRKFIDTPGELYKCPHFYCPFSTNDRSLLMCHLNGHKCDAAVMVPCVYCDVKTPWEHVPTHIDIRHASCKFACRHCLYRAITKEYVYLHLEEAHHNREFMVIALPVHKAAKRFSVAESKINMKKICQPYRCICKDPNDESNGVLEYLFETEFVSHLAEAHPENIVLCGYPGCVNRITTSMMPQHWAIFHGVNVFQCAHCKMGSKDIATLFAHFAQTHPNFMPDILVRRNEYLPQDRQLRFTDEAFKLLAHIRKFPNNFSAIIRQRAQRSVKLIHLVNPTCTLDESAVAKVSELPVSSGSVGSSLLLKSATKLTPVSGILSQSSTMQGVLVASTTANSETLYLLPTSAISTTNKSLSTVTSVASTSKILVKTSGASFAGLVQLEPVKIGNNITIYPEDKNAVDYPSILTPITTTQSSVKIGNLTIYPSNGNAREIPLTKTVPNLSDSTWNSNYLVDLPVATANNSITTSTLSVKSPNILRDLVKLAGITGPVEEVPPVNITKSSITGNNTVEDQGNSKVFGEENECITISDDDLLQSAIQSILDQEDESLNKDVGNNLTKNSTASSEPPPLIPLVNNTNNNSNKISSTTEVEHINVPNNNVNDCHIQPKKNNSSINNMDNDDNNSSEVSFINTDSVDPLLDDPLDITPSLNMSLSPERLIIDENALDPLETDETIKKPENSLKINNTTISLISASDDESDSGHNDKKKRNLLGNQLFRCSICTLSFPNVKSFKLHLSTSLNCRKTGMNAFRCTHCDKGVKSTRRLIEHIMTHGVQRFSCSLCTGKFATVGIIKLHMKNKHCITQSSLVPLNPIMADIDADEFILKPSSNNTPKEKEVKVENPLENTDNCIYSPDQINDIPIRQIFTTNVKCGLCNYQTKVRVNIIRHLQMHLDEKSVPDSAPVNPVPCLEKNEKMFDKMTNLAASSFTTSTTTGRMGSAGLKSAKEKLEDDNSPEFIPSYRRYVCCAPNCAYLCPEEGNLKHHLMALHNDEKHFVCFHCKINIETADIDYVMKHFKLHGLHLYRCQNCDFVHNLKHKVEKHISDRHGGDVSVITVRSMDSEPIEQQNKEENTLISQSAPSSVPLKSKRPWSCCMCKAKYSTREDMQNHIVKKHNIDTQYKCTLCVFKADDEETCDEHFKEKHPDHDFDIILVYQKVDEDAAKVEIPTPFDTTPLWQRDKPRIRHIRGILFDEPTDIQPIKPQKKVKVATSPLKVTSPLKDLLKGPNSNRNLADCIDAVAKGTAEILQAKMIKAESFSKINENLVVDYDDDIILTSAADPTIIVLESDESDSEKAKKNMTRGKSVQKTVKIESFDDNTKMRLSRENLLKEFGPLGSPSNLKQWKCPKCEQFKSKRVADFMFHLYKDFKTYRYRCSDCKDMSISFKYMEQHLRVHPEENEDIIERLPAQPALDTWIQMVIREQSLVIVENSSPIKIRPITGPTDIQCYFCNEKFMSMPECCEHMVYHWIKMPYSCLYCDCGFYTLFELQDHHKIEHPNEKISLIATGPTLQKAMECVENLKKRSASTSEVMDSPILIRKKKKSRLSETSTSSCSFSESSMANEEIEDLPLINTRKSSTCNSDDDDNNNDYVYACDVCVHITKTESEILEHLNKDHKLALRKYHVLSKKGSEQDSAQKFACNICDNIFSELKLRRHFIEDHLGKFKYYKPYKFRCNYCNGKFISVSRLKQHSTRIHTNKKYSFESVIPPDNDDEAIIIEKNNASEIAKIRRKYCCTICSYTTISSNTMTIRGHVRTHLKPFSCDHCKKQFKYNNEVEAHSAVHHPEMKKSSTVLKDTLKELNDRLKIIVAAGVVVEEEREEEEEEEVEEVEVEDTKDFVKNIARKSTSTPFVRKSISNDEEEGFSFYGVPSKQFDLSKIPTTFEIDNMQYSASVEEMMKMINLNTYVDLIDCIASDECITMQKKC